MVYVALDNPPTIGKFGRGWRRLVGHGRSSRESVPIQCSNTAIYYLNFNVQFSKNVPRRCTRRLDTAPKSMGLFETRPLKKINIRILSTSHGLGSHQTRRPCVASALSETEARN